MGRYNLCIGCLINKCILAWAFLWRLDLWLISHLHQTQFLWFVQIQMMNSGYLDLYPLSQAPLWSQLCVCVSWFQLWFGGWGWGWQPELCVGMWLRWREDFRSLWAGVQRTGGTGRRKWLSGFGGILGCVETSTFWKVGYSFSKCKNTSVSSWWELQPRVWRPLKRRLSACQSVRPLRVSSKGRAASSKKGVLVAKGNQGIYRTAPASMAQGTSWKMG